MFKKISLGTAAALTALTAMPAAADARHRTYSDYGYEQSYQSYPGDSYGYRGDSYQGRGDGYGYRGQSQRYYDDRDNGRRCSGTTGTIIGGVAGALLGREVSRGGSRYRNGSGATGTILGGAIGALAGRAVAKSSCRNRY